MRPAAQARLSRAGVTLLEVLIAITLLSLLTVGMMMALRIGLFAFSRTDEKLMENRRVAGAQRIIQQELEGLMPVIAPCGNRGGPTVIFQGLPGRLTMVSTFSLQEAWRGRPQILQFFVISSEEGAGVRLVVNETPYTGPLGAGRMCTGTMPDPASGAPIPAFIPPQSGPTSFVLADHLSSCRFSYLTPPPEPGKPWGWLPSWAGKGWPMGIRIEMAPVDPNPARLQPTTVTAPLYINRDPEVQYADR